MRQRWPSWSLVVALVIGLLLAPTTIIALALSGGLQSDGVSDPPGWEVGVGRQALAASLNRRAAGLTNPISPNDEAALLEGLRLYRNNCAGCHGDSTGASAWGTKGFYPRVPQFWQQHVQITPTEAYAAVHDGIRYSGMGAWRDLITEEEMWRVSNFVSRIHDLPPSIEARPR